MIPSLSLYVLHMLQPECICNIFDDLRASDEFIHIAWSWHRDTMARHLDLGQTARMEGLASFGAATGDGRSGPGGKTPVISQSTGELDMGKWHGHFGE